MEDVRMIVAERHSQNCWHCGGQSGRNMHEALGAYVWRHREDLGLTVSIAQSTEGTPDGDLVLFEWDGWKYRTSHLWFVDASGQVHPFRGKTIPRVCVVLDRGGMLIPSAIQPVEFNSLGQRAFFDRTAEEAWERFFAQNNLKRLDLQSFVVAVEKTFPADARHWKRREE